ncbi:hypothetical protein J2772_004737 [Chryseobacterium jejuense]|nr:hypothetical protein [Chryseobacterium jejuense]MBP2619521.1 hypothetical protein [Chryseobacterium jejuense]
MYLKSPTALIKNRKVFIHKIGSENLLGKTIADAGSKKQKPVIRQTKALGSKSGISFSVVGTAKFLPHVPPNAQ